MRFIPMRQCDMKEEVVCKDVSFYVFYKNEKQEKRNFQQ